MAGTSDNGDSTPKDFKECVSQEQLQATVEKVHDGMNEAIKKAVTDALIELNLGNNIERLDKRISTLTDRVTELETRLTTNNDDVSGSNTSGQMLEDTVYDANGNIDQAAIGQARLRQRLRRNTQGMGSTVNQHRHQGNNNHAPDDPYAKIKLTVPNFSGRYDAEGYLDWEMTLEQKFNSHLVPEQHRVRLATSEFKDFAIIWWNGLAGQGALPDTWERLKVAMRDRFVPPSYHRDLRNKLQHLEQGEKSVQDYYAELQKGLMRCGIVEGLEDSICRFYSGLRREIQDIVDYKEFHTVNQLFQFAMLAEKELQGREQRNRSNVHASYTPRTTAPSGLPKP
jgi:hypothetical protein